ncbi:hypothetical protein [Aureivirga sp. CE67]|uniref:hypothetical protein n=1 Tax=Aureivirga sp. CE67 TaxID=1788983 RepID=UPI0018CA44A5|nr:hypothetical protein [Aureivirga sp. CE67]
MKAFVKYFFLIVLLISCNEEKQLLDYSQQRANQFVEKHADKFIKDSELLRYSYNPRAQFTNSQDSSNRYRIYQRRNEIELICFSDSCELEESFNKIPLKIYKGRYTLKQDSLFVNLNNDSTALQIHSFKRNPVDYFNELNMRLKNYGVFNYFGSKDKSFIKVYFSTQYYLIHSYDVENDIGQDELLKSYDNNWYFVKMKHKMDLG